MSVTSRTRVAPSPRSSDTSVRSFGARTPGAVAFIVVGVALLVYPLVVQTSLGQNIGVIALTMGIAATGWNLLGGVAGQLSFGHAVFWATGMYTTALLVRAGWSPWASIPVCAAVAAVLAVAVGLPTFRMGGHTFAIATIMIGLIASTVVSQIDPLGGVRGLSLPTDEYSLWTMQFPLRDKTPYYYLALGLFAVVTAVAVLIVRGRTGLYWRAIRDDQVAAAATGIPVLRYKLIAAAVSAAITSVGGTYQVMISLYVDPASSLELSLSTSIAVMALLGGAGSMWGPLVGSWVLVAVVESSRSLLAPIGRTTDLLVSGALIIVIMMLEPRGVVGLISRFFRRVARSIQKPILPTRSTSDGA